MIDSKGQLYSVLKDSIMLKEMMSLTRSLAKPNEGQNGVKCAICIFQGGTMLMKHGHAWSIHVQGQ